MYIDLIELQPSDTRNRLWISEFFQSPIRRFDGSLRANTFPLFIVHGDANRGIEDRSINFKLFPHLNEKGHGFGLIHIQYENYDHDVSVYYLDKCILVFREHFRPSGGVIHLAEDYIKSFFLPTYHNSSHSGFKSLPSKINARFAGRLGTGVFPFMKRQYLPRLPSTKEIFHIPLGYPDVVLKAKENQANIKKYSHNQVITKRPYKWSFCGDSSKKDRKLMLECLKNCHPNFIYTWDSVETSHFEMLSVEDYWKIMTQSIFIPCPLGNITIETYSLFDTLEAGAIPIILKGYAFQPYDYYKNLLGDHPIPTFSSWQEVEVFLENINVGSIQELSEKIRKWYTSFNLNLKIRIHLSR